MKKNFLIFLFAVMATQLNAQTPDWQWANRAGGTPSEEGTAISNDAEGNTYVTGFFSTSISGPNTDLFGSIPVIGYNASDIFIAKYDSTGNLVWAKSAGGGLDDKSKGIALDINGNVYITGYFNSPVINFDSISLNTTMGNDLFIAKYNNNGDILWAKNVGGGSGDYSNSIATDEMGNSFITGYFTSASILFGTTTLNNPFSASGGHNYFIAKFDSSGNHVWARTATGSNVTGNSIRVNEAGNIFVSGFITGSVSFDSINVTSNGSKDFFTARFDALGNAIWVKNEGGSAEDVANAIDVDADGNTYVAGYIKSITVGVGGTNFFNNGAPDGDMLLIKYDSTGTVIWAKKSNNSSHDLASAIAVDSTGNSYVTGYFNGSSITFGTITLNGGGVSTTTGDFFVVKYDANGNVSWAKNLVATTGARGSGIALDLTGSCYLTGFFEDVTMAFGSTILTNAGNQGSRDVFLGKIGNPITVSLSEISKPEIIIFPNPTSGKFMVRDYLNNNSKIKVLSIIGEVIFETSEYLSQIEIDLSTQPEGIYIVYFTNNKGFTTNRKMIIR